MLPLFKACQEIQGEVNAEKFRAVSVVISTECPFMGCVWALPFHTVALVMLETTCCYLSIHVVSFYPRIDGWPGEGHHFAEPLNSLLCCEFLSLVLVST